MVKRELTELEKRICVKQIEKLKKEKEHLDWLYRYNEMMLSEGLRRNYEEKVKEFKGQKQTLIDDMMNSEEKIRVLNDQIIRGVEEKDCVEVDSVKGGYYG